MGDGSPRNVVLLCLDTVREDYFREYADRLQQRATEVYWNCHAASSWSVPSHASMFTGTLPHQHGIHTYNRDFSGLSRADTFLGDLPEHRAIAASANVWAGPAFGFDTLFDEFIAVSPDRRFADGIDVSRFGQSTDTTGIRRQWEFLQAALRHDHPLASLANGVAVQLEDWFERAPVPKPFDDGAKTIAQAARTGVAGGDEPFVLFANLMDAHGPLHHVRGYDRNLHNAPNGWTSADIDWSDVCEHLPDPAAKQEVERYRGLYAAAIEYLDRVVSDLIDWLQRSTERPTSIVVTSDHGDHLADTDDHRWGHVESNLAEELLHVPLVVIESEKAESRTVSEPVSHLNLPDLLTGLAGGSPPSIEDEPVLGERLGHSGRLADVEQWRDTAADRAVRCVIDGPSKSNWDQTGVAWTTRLDPAAPNTEEPCDAPVDIAGLEAEFFDQPIAQYAEEASQVPDESRIDDRTQERLEKLGYR